MGFEDTPAEAAFRGEARAFLAASAHELNPSQGGVRRADLAQAREWQATKAQAGFAAITLPPEWGGRGLGPAFQAIYDQEEAGYDVPRGRWFRVGMGMCIPTMIRYARREQLERHVPPAIRGEEVWCQLFSESVAGSDLAGIVTRAQRDAGEWVVNGQKVWTSGARFSDYGLLLARSDPSAAKHQGLTAFYVDMKSPGIEVRPIKQMTGASGFNEVFFTDVRIPDAQRLGAPGEGWKVAVFTLMNERLAVGRATDLTLLEDMARLAMRSEGAATPNETSASAKEAIAELMAVASGVQYLGLRNLTAFSQGRSPGPEASVVKLVSTQLGGDIARTALQFLGPAACLAKGEHAGFDGRFQDLWLGAAAEKIGGGTEEILLNVLAERVLALPPEPRVDKRS
jgi:alkylation response protein AidB-like acyl-CoA dehydrogenase